MRLTPGLAKAPVLLISAEPPDRGLWNMFKPDEYIQKPFDMRDLLARVERMLGEYACPAEAER